MLSDGAQAVEAFAQDGARWGLKITYSFLDPDEDPDLFLKRSPELWTGGLFYLRAPLFPRRSQGRCARSSSTMPPIYASSSQTC